MRARREIEFRRRAPAAYLHIIGGAFSHWHAGVRNVGDGEQELFQALVEFVDVLVVALESIGNFLHLRQKLRGVFAGSFLARNFFAGAVALGLQALGGGDELAARGVNLAKGREVQSDAAIARHLFNRVEVLPYVSQIQHSLSRIQEGSGGCEAAVAGRLLADRLPAWCAAAPSRNRRFWGSCRDEIMRKTEILNVCSGLG